MVAASKRRWYQFSLRSLMIAVLILPPLLVGVCAFVAITVEVYKRKLPSVSIKRPIPISSAPAPNPPKP